jgi:hypothetical protein
MQEMAREIAVKAGFPAGPYDDLLLFSEEWGVVRIDSPLGDGCWITMDTNEARAGKGAEWHDHNVETALSQSLLMALWVFYSQMVELDVDPDPD